MDEQSRRQLALLNGAYAMLSRGWRQGIDTAIDQNTAWTRHDAVIQRVVADFQARLSGASMPPLDWRLIKAMIWTETGAGSIEWSRRTMQIGVAGDPGMKVVLTGAEKIELVLPSDERGDLAEAEILSKPASNIKAGVAYLLNRMAVAEPFEEPDASRPEIAEHEVAKGETFDLIAKHCGSSSQWLQSLNGGSNKLSVGQKVKVQATRRGRRIKSWHEFTPENMQTYYNGNGDSHYAQKLRYALGVMDIADQARLRP